MQMQSPLCGSPVVCRSNGAHARHAPIFPGRASFPLRRRTCASSFLVASCLVAWNIKHERQRKLALSAAKEPETIPCFRAVEMPRRGVGLFATRDIAKGELVLAESPVISFIGSDVWWMREAQDQFALLSPQVQKQILSLVDAFQLVDDIFPGGVRKTLEGILKTNSYMRGKKGTNSHDGVLCLITSRFNHSCVPNLIHHWDDDTLQHVAYANSDIAADDELLTDYLHPATPKTERREILFQRYGFLCDCATCSQSTEQECDKDGKS